MMQAGQEAAGERVEFYSDGTRLIGDVFWPVGQRRLGTLSGVVICDGWGVWRNFMAAGVAAVLADRGLAAFAFDYRGFGDSDGTRGRLRPTEQVDDVHAAVACLSSDARVDQRRIAVLGLGFGGAVAVQAASESEAIAAVLCVTGFGDGTKLLRSLRRHPEWLRLQSELRADRVHRAVSGSSKSIDPQDVFIRDAHTAAHEEALRSRSDDRRNWRIDLATVDAILAFSPETSINAFLPRASMFAAVEDDGLTPIDASFSMYEKARSPKRLLVLESPAAHHAIYERDNWAFVLDSFANFFQACASDSGCRRDEIIRFHTESPTGPS